MTHGAPHHRSAVPIPPDGAGAAPPLDLAVPSPCLGTRGPKPWPRRSPNYDPKADTGLIIRAFEVAAAAHAAQTRDNGDPYITHPLAVAETLAGYRLDVSSILTALLHDVIEDTRVTLPELERQFGAGVAGWWMA